MLNERDRKRLLIQLGGRPAPTPLRIILRSIDWRIVGGFAALLILLGIVLWQGDTRWVSGATFGFVVVGWVFSLCLHEFTHAATAVLGGDDSPSTQRYLSFNPLHYVHPFFSIVFPLVFLLLGGIGLPGGAVYLRRELVRGRYWQSMISLSAPLANLLLGALLALPVRLGLLTGHLALTNAFAVLSFFQVMAALLNLLPIPPLDGFGALAPYLPAEVRAAAYSVGNFSVFILFLIFWYAQPVSDAFYQGIFNLLGSWGLDPIYVQLGLAAFFSVLHR